MEEDKEQGTAVFAPAQNPDDVWEAATITSVDGHKCSVKYLSGKTATFNSSELLFRDAGRAQQNEANLGLLHHLNEASLLENLHTRYAKNEIYTETGAMLIAVNPFQYLPIYNDATVSRYSNPDSAVGLLPPHAFAVGQRAYSHMRKEKKDQAVLISGESGAGKTETAKIIMNYIASVSGGLDASGKGTVAERVLQSNPILEAFGNAKTVRNKNSSRFGKFVDMQFDHEGKMVGASINTYLLEKSRVVKQAQNERNYHMFYQLCAAKPDAVKAFGVDLKKASEFHYLNQGAAEVIEGKDDVEDFEKTEEALEFIGVTVEQEQNIHRIVAAILYLGELDFLTSPINVDRCVLKKTDDVDRVCKLLGSNPQDLEKALTTLRIVARSETYEKNMNREQCLYLRDAMAKQMYSLLFNWIVERINAALAFQPAAAAAAENVTRKGPHSSRKPQKAEASFIGVLDIFGFEELVRNSFEQVCINYANEKLQQLFIETVLKREQEEYLSENIEWVKVLYNDNEDCVRLLEQRLGILSLLDEECRFPNGTDESYTLKVNQNCKVHERFICISNELLVNRARPKTTSHSRNLTPTRSANPSRSPSPTGGRNRSGNVTPVQSSKLGTEAGSSFKAINTSVDANRSFGIKHYARDVLYDTVGFLEKNKDELSQDIVTFLSKVDFKLLSDLFLADVPGTKKTTTSSADRPSVSLQFRRQLDLLMSKLRPRTLNYISCIKPNTELEAGLFSRLLVAGQLQCAGVLEAIQVARKMYPFRYLHDDFYNKYKVCVPSMARQEGSKAAVEGILRMLAPGQDVNLSYQIGRTKVFMMAPCFKVVEAAYLKYFEKKATIIAAFYRMTRERKKRICIKRCIMKIEHVHMVRKFLRVVNTAMNEEQKRKLKDQMEEAVRRSEAIAAAAAAEGALTSLESLRMLSMTEGILNDVGTEEHITTETDAAAIKEEKEFMSIPEKTMKIVIALAKLVRARKANKAKLVEIPEQLPEDLKSLFEVQCEQIRTLLTESGFADIRLKFLLSFYNAFHSKLDIIEKSREFENPETLYILASALLKCSTDKTIKGEWPAAIMAVLSIFALSEKNAQKLVEVVVVQCALGVMDRLAGHEKVQLTALMLLQSLGRHASVQVAVKKGARVVFKYIADCLNHNIAKTSIVRSGLNSLDTWLKACPREYTLRRCPLILRAMQRHVSDARTQVIGCSLLVHIHSKPKGILSFGKSFREVCQAHDGFSIVASGLNMHHDNVNVVTHALEFLVVMARRPGTAKAIVNVHLVPIVVGVMACQGKNKAILGSCLKLLSMLCATDEGKKALSEQKGAREAIEHAIHIANVGDLHFEFLEAGGSTHMHVRGL